MRSINCVYFICDVVGQGSLSFVDVVVVARICTMPRLAPFFLFLSLLPCSFLSIQSGTDQISCLASQSDEK